MTRRTRFLLGTLLAALTAMAGLEYLLLHGEPVYGGKSRSWWKEHLADVQYEMVPPPGWLQGLVWKVNPWKKATFAGMRPLSVCKASPALLADMLADTDADFRYEVVFALGAHYGYSPQSHQTFLRATWDGDGRVRRMAFSGLFFFPQDRSWTPAMSDAYMRLLTDGDPSVRSAWPHLPQDPQAREAISRALQERAKIQTLNTDEARVLQELQQTPSAAPEGPSP
jgi:hypothetical protein